jgi:crotonobetainyl-CoA:carnitine CoA-transferase CaiB-like acyl-CoA transferase
VHARRARRCEEGPEVGLGHLDAILQLARAFGETACPALGLRPQLPVLTCFFPGGLQLRAELGHLLPQLHQPIHRCSAEVRIGQATTPGAAWIVGSLAGASSSALDRLAFTLGHGRLVQESVGATRRLQPAPRNERPHCPSDRQWVGEAQFPAKLSWRGFQQLPLACAIRDSGEEGIDALEALLVHSRILPDCHGNAPVVRKCTQARRDEVDKLRFVDGPPLSGIRVLDLSRVLAGPLATQVLGDMGADVIKIERPTDGDDTRHWGPPFVGEDAAYYLSLNRNKRSVALDLKTPAGIEAVRRLATGSDVLIENFRPGLMAELGLAPEELRRSAPGLITCSLTAFSDDVADAGRRPGYDIMAQALSGLMSVTGEPGGEPVKAGVALLDVITGLQAAIGILAALHDRTRTGRGRHVSVSLFDASAAAMVNQAANHLIGGTVAGPMGTAHPNICPYQAFHASDRPFILAAGNDRLFRRTCEVVGHPEWAEDPRYLTNEERVRHRDELIQLLGAAFSTRSADQWIEALEAASVPCAPIRAMDEVFASPEGAAIVESVNDPARGTTLRLVRNPIRFDGRVLDTRRAPPLLGEHTDEVLRET